MISTSSVGVNMLRVFRQALATKPTSKDALFKLGNALRGLGELDGETPREEEKSAAEKAMIEAEAEREAEGIRAMGL